MLAGLVAGVVVADVAGDVGAQQGELARRRWCSVICSATATPRGYGEAQRGMSRNGCRGRRGSREPEDLLAEDVVLDLVGAAGDRLGGHRDQHLGDDTASSDRARSMPSAPASMPAPRPRCGRRLARACRAILRTRGRPTARAAARWPVQRVSAASARAGHAVAGDRAVAPPGESASSGTRSTRPARCGYHRRWRRTRPPRRRPRARPARRRVDGPPPDGAKPRSWASVVRATRQPSPGAPTRCRPAPGRR